jgi:hypothetical protein
MSYDTVGPYPVVVVETESVMERGPGNIALSDNKAERRYEVRVRGDLAGFCNYELHDGYAVIPHTEVRPSFEGRGIGAKLVAYALDDLRARHLGVVPSCSFVASYISEHAEYADLELDR